MIIRFKYSYLKDMKIILTVLLACAVRGKAIINICGQIWENLPNYRSDQNIFFSTKASTTMFNPLTAIGAGSNNRD